MSAYAWEGLVERSWDALVEDDDGGLRTLTNNDSAYSHKNAKRRIQAALFQDGPICRRMIRYVCVVVDMSRSMVNIVSFFIFLFSFLVA